MKKKEIRWLSRDGSGDYAIWFKKPCKKWGIWMGKRISRICDIQAYAGIMLKYDGLAKITIERQY